MLKLNRSIFCSVLLFSQISCYSLNTNFPIDLSRIPANEGPVGSLSGKVLNEKNEPIRGAVITVVEEGRIVSTVTTDELGNYKASGLPVREYSVNAWADGFRADTYMVRVLVETDIEYTFTLSAID